MSAPCHLCGLSSWCVAWRQHKCFYSLRAHQLFFWCEHWFFWRGFGQVDASLPFVLAIAYQISDPRMSVVWFPDLLSSLLNPWCQLMLPRGKLKPSILVSCSFLALVKCLYLSLFWLIIIIAFSLSLSLVHSPPSLPLRESEKLIVWCLENEPGTGYCPPYVFFPNSNMLDSLIFIAIGVTFKAVALLWQFYSLCNA